MGWIIAWLFSLAIACLFGAWSQKKWKWLGEQKQ